MVGPHLLYAPIVDKGAVRRDVYLPRGVWIDAATGKTHLGPSWTTSEADMPLYVRANSAVPTSDGLWIFGEGKWIVYTDEGAVAVSRRDNAVELGETWRSVHILGEWLEEVVVNGERHKAVHTRLGTYVSISH